MVIWCCQVFPGLLGEYSWHSSAHDYDVGRCGILFSEAQREGVFLALQYIVFTFDFLGINLVIWAQLQVHYLILVLTNGMNRIKKNHYQLWLIYWTPVNPHGFSLSLVYDKMLSGSFLETLVLAWQNLLALLMAIWLMVRISLWIVRISLS